MINDVSNSNHLRALKTSNPKTKPLNAIFLTSKSSSNFVIPRPKLLVLTSSCPYCFHSADPFVLNHPS